MSSPNQYDCLTPTQCEDIYRKDMKRFEDCVGKNVKVPITSNQYSSLVSFAYNVGCGAFQESTLLKKLNGGDYEAVCGQMNRWVNGDGKVLPGLVRRRGDECKLWNDGKQGSTGSGSGSANKPTGSASSPSQGSGSRVEPPKGSASRNQGSKGDKGSNGKGSGSKKKEKGSTKKGRGSGSKKKGNDSEKKKKKKKKKNGSKRTNLGKKSSKRRNKPKRSPKRPSGRNGFKAIIAAARVKGKQTVQKMLKNRVIRSAKRAISTWGKNVVKRALRKVQAAGVRAKSLLGYGFVRKGLLPRSLRRQVRRNPQYRQFGRSHATSRRQNPGFIAPNRVSVPRRRNMFPGMSSRQYPRRQRPQYRFSPRYASRHHQQPRHVRRVSYRNPSTRRHTSTRYGSQRRGVIPRKNGRVVGSPSRPTQRRSPNQVSRRSIIRRQQVVGRRSNPKRPPIRRHQVAQRRTSPRLTARSRQPQMRSPQRNGSIRRPIARRQVRQPQRYSSRYPQRRSQPPRRRRRPVYRRSQPTRRPVYQRPTRNLRVYYNVYRAASTLSMDSDESSINFTKEEIDAVEQLDSFMDKVQARFGRDPNQFVQNFASWVEIRHGRDFAVYIRNLLAGRTHESPVIDRREIEKLNQNLAVEFHVPNIPEDVINSILVKMNSEIEDQKILVNTIKNETDSVKRNPTPSQKYLHKLLIHKLARRTRSLIRSIEHRETQRRLHGRTRNLILRIFKRIDE